MPWCSGGPGEAELVRRHGEEQDGKQTLQKVTGKREETPSLADASEHVGGPDISTADRADGDTVCPGNNEAERHRSEQVGREGGAGVHPRNAHEFWVRDTHVLTNWACDVVKGGAKPWRGAGGGIV